MRAFVALTPPARVLAELEAVVAPLRAAHPELRWTPATQWHVTLAFLGEIDDAVRPDLGERLARAARRHRPTALALGGGGRFGDRVLWVRVDTAPDGAARDPGSERRPGVDALRRLAASVTAAARRSGIAVDARSSRPHLTLARARAGAELRPAVASLAGFAGSAWPADALHLVRSRLGAGPAGTALHEVVGTWTLGRCD